jgi:hypothetical protein
LHAAIWVHNLSCSTKVASLQAETEHFQEAITEP